ncbi:MAG TPA: FHA domain-containing protein, partial [Candidatus Thermoplasmatota archaeon]|nr:FHA domain-containing protein [Candidatus Thermoplasmatota archaeon]
EGPERGPWIVGRDPECEVHLPGDAFVSGKHAQIERHGGAHRVRDLFSKNGTLLDWERLPAGEPRPLENGQVVGIGKTLLLFRDR